MSASLNINGISISEFQGSSGHLLTTENDYQNVASVAENTSEIINTHHFDNFQYNHQQQQQFVQVLPTNENNVHHHHQVAVVPSGYYHTTTTHASPLRRRQPNNLTDSKRGVINSDDVIFTGNQETHHAQLFPSEASLYFTSYDTNSQTEISRQHQQFSSVNADCPTITTTALTTITTPILNSNVTSTASLECDSTSTMINPSTKLSIDAVRMESDNSNLTFGNYSTTEYSRASSNTTTTTTTLPLDNSESRAVNFTSNRLLEKQQRQYNPNIQTEAINSVLAHQWHERREKLPATLDATFYTEWQINRPTVVNTAEIQKRKLQHLLVGKASEKQLGRVDQHNENYLASKQTKQQQQQQQHHLYRLHQMQQQQNHLRSPTPDSFSSSRQLAHSPLSLDSSTASGPQFQQQQKLADARAKLPLSPIQTQETCNTLPIYDNSMLNSVSAQQLVLQALQQQQYFQQLLILQHLNQATVGSDSLNEKRQEFNQQKHHEALQENTSQHKSTYNSGQVLKKRKRQRSPTTALAQKIVDDKENVSENSSERALVIDESAVSPSNVQLDDSKRDDESGSNKHEVDFEQRIVESVIVNLDDVAALSSSGQKSVKLNQRSKDKISSESSPAGEPSGMWLNNYTMFRDWITSQQSIVDQHQNEIIHSDI